MDNQDDYIIFSTNVWQLYNRINTMETVGKYNLNYYNNLFFGI